MTGSKTILHLPECKVSQFITLCFEKRKGILEYQEKLLYTVALHVFNCILQLSIGESQTDHNGDKDTMLYR